MPSDFGYPSINIQQHSAAFKAKKHLNGWAKFVHATKLCLKHIISMKELTEIRRLFCEFITYYEKEYIQNNSTRLPAALISYHYLLHIADSIYNTGSGWATWQYPIERLCGMLLPLLIGTNSKKSSESHVFTTNSAEKVLYSLSHKYCMNRTEIQRLRAYYVTALNRNANQLSLITNSIQKYGKLQTKNELIINSKLSSRKGDVKLLVDQNAHRPNAPVILEEREFFGEVQYFFSHQYTSHRSMLAYVQWVRNPQPSGHGPLKFRDNSAFEVINVSAICRNVGFLKMSFISLIEKIKLNFDDFYIFLFNQIDTDADLQNRTVLNILLIYI
ncbi:hypothetical protein RhiirB3_429730 [Rhizophagus irregularis]|nr:hypothetical protein RhiirB3_429730 [Rhizophagus irregularis]